MRGCDCFLSHNSKDKPAVRALKAALEARGLSCWLDEDQLRPGLPWQTPLERGIRDARSVAVCVGADGLGPWEDQEMQAALGLAVRDGRPVIPVLLRGAPAKPKLPLFLSNRTWVDLRTGIDGAALDRLVWGISGNGPDGAAASGPCESAQSPSRRRAIPTAAALAALTFAAGGLVWLAPWLPPEQSLAGQVADTDGRPLAGIRVAVPELHVAAVTDSDGWFRLRVRAEPGRRVRLSVSADGRYRPYPGDLATLGNTRIGIQLEPAGRAGLTPESAVWPQTYANERK